MIGKGKCKKCGKEVYRIHLYTNEYISCEPEQFAYRQIKSGKQKIVTPNGEILNGVITTDMQLATGIGYIVHCCSERR